MILAQYRPLGLEVEIIDVYTSSDNRKRVRIRATSGEPFTMQTHGGPMATDCLTTSPDLLAGVRQIRERKSVLASGGNRPELTYGPMNEEYAALFPSRFVRNRQPSQARGGINND